MPTQTDHLLELPRVRMDELSYSRFLSEYALPRVPCIIEGVGADWPAADRWGSLDYFLTQAGVERGYPCTVSVGDVDEHETTVGEALRMLRERVEQAASTPAEPDTGGASGERVYINAWDFVRGGSEALQQDFAVPSHFDRSPAWLAEHAVFGNAAVDLRWLYIGEHGTGSPTHIDPNLSSAWLWVAHGEKVWVCAHGDDRQLISDAGAGEPGAYGGDALPDLFAPDLLDQYPSLRGARLYGGVQRAGEVVFNPSGCVHAVRNASPLVVSCTHNFIDATNLTDALADATRSFRTEMIPMVSSLGPKLALRTLAQALHLKRPAVARLLAGLPELLSAERVARLMEAAVDGAAGEGERAEVRQVLTRHLELGLARERPAFEAAARELCAQLGIEAAAS
jgi:hypothetical protein